MNKQATGKISKKGDTHPMLITAQKRAKKSIETSSRDAISTLFGGTPFRQHYLGRYAQVALTWRERFLIINTKRLGGIFGCCSDGEGAPSEIVPPPSPKRA